MSEKIISMSYFKVCILHAKFCMIPCYSIRDRTITIIWGKTEKKRPYMRTQIASFLFLIINIARINFCAKSSTRKLRLAYSKNSAKSVTITPTVVQFSPRIDRLQFMLK